MHNNPLMFHYGWINGLGTRTDTHIRYNDLILHKKKKIQVCVYTVVL